MPPEAIDPDPPVETPAPAPDIVARPPARHAFRRRSAPVAAFRWDGLPVDGYEMVPDPTWRKPGPAPLVLKVPRIGGTAYAQPGDRVVEQAIAGATDRFVYDEREFAKQYEPHAG